MNKHDNIPLKQSKNWGLIIISVVAILVASLGLAPYLPPIKLPSVPRIVLLPGNSTLPPEGMPVGTNTQAPEAQALNVIPKEDGVIQPQEWQIVWVVKDGALQTESWEDVDPSTLSLESYLKTQIVCESGSFVYQIPEARSVFMLKAKTQSSTWLRFDPGEVNALSCTRGDVFAFYAQ